MHGAKNYPFRKAASTLDVAFDDRVGDAEYLATLEPHLEQALAVSGPDLVCYLAGADPYAGDRLGRLALSIEGLRRRDRLVIDACRARALPVAVVMAGGYAADLADLVTIHTNTVAELRRAYG
jgi:acetoin utilization deacetylase AcuC-like enzyme